MSTSENSRNSFYILVDSDFLWNTPYPTPRPTARPIANITIEQRTILTQLMVSFQVFRKSIRRKRILTSIYIAKIRNYYQERTLIARRSCLCLFVLTRGESSRQCEDRDIQRRLSVRLFGDKRSFISVLSKSRRVRVSHRRPTSETSDNHHGLAS